MGSNPQSFAHLNLHHGMAVTKQLPLDVTFIGYDIVSLNEPYVREDKFLGIPEGYTQVSSNGSNSGWPSG